MNVGILGTGMVGAVIGTKMIQLGHKVKMGSRAAGNEKASEWVRANGANASQGTFADCAPRRSCAAEGFTPSFGLRPAPSRRPPQRVPFLDGRARTPANASCPDFPRMTLRSTHP